MHSQALNERFSEILSRQNVLVLTFNKLSFGEVGDRVETLGISVCGRKKITSLKKKLRLQDGREIER